MYWWSFWEAIFASRKTSFSISIIPINDEVSDGMDLMMEPDEEKKMDFMNLQFEDDFPIQIFAFAYKL